MDSNRRTRTWSLSRKSKDHTPIKFSPEEKRRSKMSSSADPTTAITEDEPFAVSQSKPNVGLRGYQYKDIYGNPITEPDLSNPTRSRWERPLDTIRSFEAAINVDSKCQSAFYVVDTMDSTDQSQRQMQHNPGPFDPSLYHRNHGAQRYAPVDPYESQGNPYTRHNSQDSVLDYGRPVMPASRGYSDRRSPSRTPPLGNPYSNRSMEQQYLDGRTQSMRNRPVAASQAEIRRYYDQGYHQHGSSLGSTGYDSYNYNSDPASESSSIGSNYAVPAPPLPPPPPPPPLISKEYDNIFSFSSTVDANQLNTQSPSSLNGQTDGNGNSNRYSNNPFLNSDSNRHQTNGNLYNNSAASSGGSQNPPTQNNKTNHLRKPVPLSTSGPVPAMTTPSPYKEKKKGLFRRFSKSRPEV